MYTKFAIFIWTDISVAPVYGVYPTRISLIAGSANKEVMEPNVPIG